ncbi:BatA domain-containing protein [Limnoglobus roseus]|uniref:VWA domain-containing protein n=1 Tax=Limnoglobus roseus TaxID=2598579 RepID=A0A5C1AR27_9BACT|nr:BatA domain-containing protein [Limnoglobus roseus]QEL19654.1 VWA domain-containing protein [Limnoglobus roseus]
MSFLAPLYALGLLAVAAPIWFHLIRRRPKGQVPFSSLMFLTASPPPPAQKRRLDQLLLLLLRIAALVLLGFAFMRPFLRTESTADAGGAGQRVLILIDTSASLRRGDLWVKAVAQAEEALAQTRPADRIGVWAFDQTVRPVLGFDESEHLDAGQQSAVARERLSRLKPTWGGTELGPALIEAVGAILNPGSAGGRKAGKVVLVSDLPQGAKLTGLNAFEWPADVELELRTVTDGGGNVGLDLLPDSEKGELRVRVVNDAQSRQERFLLGWAGQPAPHEVYLPPGESRVRNVPKPLPSANVTALRITGDDHEFDNSLYIATPPREEMTVFFVGPDMADDPAGLRYFLDRAWNDTPHRTVRVQGLRPDETLAADAVRPSPLVVVHGDVSEESTRGLQQYLRDGGTVLSVLTQPGSVKTLAQLADGSLDVAEAKADRYAMLQQIAFDHPLFAPLAGPQFGDFTKVHFWKHRRLTESQLAGGRVLARFDDGDAAVWEKVVGKGRLVILASGWHPADSQLARSSKFVPLMTALLELRGGRPATNTNYRVGDRVPVSTGSTAVRKPDGSIVPLTPNATTFDGADQPGVYAFETGTGSRPFAVNLDPAESLTAPLPVETLEQFGCRITKRADVERREQFERQQRDVELERNQSIWRGLILAAVLVLIFETALAGWRGRLASREGVTT